MTHIPHFNFPLFHAAAKELRKRGWEITSPAELDSPEAKKAAEESLTGDASHYAANDSWGDLLARDVKLIADGAIDAIICLPGWERSRGGKLETYVARLCGLPLLEYPTLDEIHANHIDHAHGHEEASYKHLTDRTKEIQEMEFVPDTYRDDPHEISEDRLGMYLVRTPFLVFLLFDRLGVCNLPPHVRGRGRCGLRGSRPASGIRVAAARINGQRMSLVFRRVSVPTLVGR